MNWDGIYTDELFDFVQDHQDEDPAQLLFKYHDTASDIDIREAVQQIAGRQKSKTKLPSWAKYHRLIYPPSISLEQCSSEITAKFKARWIRGKSLLDLTGGFGVDSFFMAANFDKVTYVERQEKLAFIVAWNFEILGIGNKSEIRNEDALGFIRQSNEHYDWIYLDPARRGNHNLKLYKLQDCEPDILAHWENIRQGANHVMIKASPMLDIKSALKELPDIKRVVVLAVKNEVKEVLLITKPENSNPYPFISCFNLKENEEERFDFDFMTENTATVTYAPVKDFLIEPNAAIMKTGAFASFAMKFRLDKLHANSHLYTTSAIDGSLPAKVFKIIQEVRPDKKTIKKLFPEGKVNVIVRNYPVKTEAFKQKYGLKDGGDDFLIATTTVDNKGRLFWCKKTK